MTFPSEEIPNEIPTPITRNEHELNITEREVLCPRCKYKTRTNLAGPICGHCKGFLITVTRTTPDELAG